MAWRSVRYTTQSPARGDVTPSTPIVNYRLPLHEAAQLASHLSAAVASRSRRGARGGVKVSITPRGQGGRIIVG